MRCELPRSWEDGLGCDCLRFRSVPWEFFIQYPNTGSFKNLPDPHRASFKPSVARRRSSALLSSHLTLSTVLLLLTEGPASCGASPLRHSWVGQALLGYREYRGRNSWLEGEMECRQANVIVAIVRWDGRAAKGDLVPQIGCSVAVGIWWPSG